jgi:ubiquitin-conjugating enzyme E2 D/E
LKIAFPNDYPHHPMKINFETRIFHPNIAEDGEVMIDLLHESWSPVATVSMSEYKGVFLLKVQLADYNFVVLLLITTILIDPVEPFDCLTLNHERTQLYLNNKQEFQEKARFDTEKYAV